MTKALRLLVLFLLGIAQALAIEQTNAVTVTTLLKTQTTWDGNAIVYPTGRAEITALQVLIAPGGETGWHLHPVPSFGMVLEGEVDGKLSVKLP